MEAGRGINGERDQLKWIKAKRKTVGMVRALMTCTAHFEGISGETFFGTLIQTASFPPK